jgi:hypothetical protein
MLDTALTLEGIDREQLHNWKASPSGKRLDEKAGGVMDKTTRSIMEALGVSKMEQLANPGTPEVLEAKAQALALIDAALNPPPPSLEVVSLGAFVCEDIPVARALLGIKGGALLIEGGSMLIVGNGGAGKTTLTIDAAFHLAAGLDWCGWKVEQPVRVLLIENEGPEQPFQQKLDGKLMSWEGPDGPEERISIVKRPWGSFSFASEQWRERLAAAIAEHEIDVLIGGPITAMGMEGHGTIPETRAFAALVADVRAKSGRNFGDVLVHHTRKEGGVSGAWEGTGDTLLELECPGAGKSILKVWKARWSSKDHMQTYGLKWAADESFVREEAEDKTAAVEDLLRKAQQESERAKQTLTPEQVRLPDAGVGCSLGLAKAMLDDLVKSKRAIKHEGKDVERPKANICYELAPCVLPV